MDMQDKNDDDDDGGTPRDLDELRLRLIRRLANLEQGWKRCAMRPCQRARRCIDPAAVCVASRVGTPHQDDPQNNPQDVAQDDGQVLAELHAAVRQRMAEQGWD